MKSQLSQFDNISNNDNSELDMADRGSINSDKEHATNPYTTINTQTKADLKAK